MNLKKVNIELELAEVQELLAIDMDDDAQRALAFIKEHLAKQVKKGRSRIECRFSRPVTGLPRKIGLPGEAVSG